MKKSRNKRVNELTNSFSKEYEKIMSKSLNPYTKPVQWKEKGDQLEKFTLYENYTPVKTTSGTGILNR